MIDVLGAGVVGRIQHADEITVGHLLSHRSGVYEIFEDPAFREATNGDGADVTKVWTGAELVAY